jgi:hypothetical protein
MAEEAAATGEKYENPGGATRSHRASAFHLIPRVGIQRIADRWGLGAVQHGEWNWYKSLDTEAHAAAFCKDAFNHMQEHAFKMSNGEEPEDDHLGAIGWAVCVLAQAEEKFGKRWTELSEEASA